MVHENDPERNGCPFATLFGSTPPDLVADDLYYATAFALFSGPLWSVSVATVAQALGATANGRSKGKRFSTAGAKREGPASKGKVADPLSGVGVSTSRRKSARELARALGVS